MLLIINDVVMGPSKAVDMLLWFFGLKYLSLKSFSVGLNVIVFNLIIVLTLC